MRVHSNSTPPPYAIDGTFQPNSPLSVANGQQLNGARELNVGGRAGAHLAPGATCSSPAPYGCQAVAGTSLVHTALGDPASNYT